MFLAGRDGSAPGAAVFAGMEGTRPVLVEIQALVAPSALGTPRRAVVGWDPSRLSMLLAVLEAHGRVKLGQHDIYLNVAGGMKISEPAADLAAAAALVSSLTGAVLPHDMVFFGEVGLFRSGAPGGPFQSPAEGGGKAWLFPRRRAPRRPQDKDKQETRENALRMATRPIRHIGEVIADIASLGRNSRPNLSGRQAPESTRDQPFAISGRGKSGIVCFTLRAKRRLLPSRNPSPPSRR